MKNLRKYSLGGLFFIGPAIAKLLIYYYDQWEYQHTTNDITNQQVNEYMINSQTYPMLFDTYIYKEDWYNNGSEKNQRRRVRYIYYNKNMGKYFAYFGIDLNTLLKEQFLTLKNIPFTGKVNIDEINSGKGNSIDDPILV